ncbi:MAG: phytanoyl-CoA dioxygenase family protein [Chloroflexota bacterium]|nr:phytanoyl-CoA dioxygenase family protein [Chloroflexota bacterium]
MALQTPTALDDFLFDLRGYLILRQAVTPELVDDLNRVIEQLPPLAYQEWYGNAQRRDYTESTGLELHNCVEVGEPFERLIDHPSWINYVRHYCGEEQSYVEGLFIDECILSVRGPGGHHPVHSGGYKGALRGAYQYKHGVFRCGQCNIILALTDIGPGDGATMVIPGSHKSNFPHPNAGNYAQLDRMDELEGAVELHLQKGDALLFVDGIMHGGSSRTNPGERRVVIYRYGPSWGATRFGFAYSHALLERLTPERRKILQPVPPLRPPASG